MNPVSARNPSACVRALLFLPLLGVLAAFLIYPICVLGYASLQPASGVLRGSVGAGATAFANYTELLTNPIYRDALFHSLVLSAAVAGAATVVCFAPAWLFARYVFAGKRLLRASFTLPMSLSGIIVGFLAVIMLGRVGFVPQMSQVLIGHAWLAGTAYQLTGLVIAYLYFEIPRGILTLETSLRKFCPQLEAAARSLGASRWQRFRWVALPLIAPALIRPSR